jgi:hypothetical protein
MLSRQWEHPCVDWIYAADFYTMMDVRVAILSVITLALFLQQPADDASDDAPPFISEIGSPLFMVIAAFIAVVVVFDLVRTWWQTNEWRRNTRHQRR